MSHNAVRVQLTTMERDGLVRRAGVERRTTRPSLVYELTPGAHQLLSRAYMPFLASVVRASAARYSDAQVEQLMRDAGRVLAGDLGRRAPVDGSLAARLSAASELLNAEFGALTEVVSAEGSFEIHGHGCPLAAVTGKHRVVCLAVETLVGEIVGEAVRECCSRRDPPQCCFKMARVNTNRTAKKRRALRDPLRKTI